MPHESRPLVSWLIFDVRQRMKTSTRIWGWFMTTFLLLVGISAIVSHRFVGKNGIGVVTGRTADIFGGVFILTAAWFLYLLRSAKPGRSDSSASADGR